MQGKLRRLNKKIDHIIKIFETRALQEAVKDWMLSIHDHKMSGEIMACILYVFILLLNNDTMQSAKSFTGNSTFQPLRPPHPALFHSKHKHNTHFCMSEIPLVNLKEEQLRCKML